ncbi:hypothetical protein [Allorhodopirellula solitaria]|uniref:Uncharacterized protein n=1 Tax=Allorhodopirellula solitaria TaxID=2527987 RepID=A0A5C5XS58_9BACT|nr:hypothetical protein [Allorhodopirellula solitaria]TWT65213.1 hypothetical protein CA85_31240 [Allorhodopirellula solitaria]
MKILTRSYLIDIGLVGLASFALVCVLGKACWDTGESADRHSFTVEIQSPDRPKATYLVGDTGQTADQLRADIVQRMIGRRTPDVAWMQWYRETAQRYAAACSAPAAGPLAEQTETPSVFRTVSTESNSPRSAGVEAESLSRWQGFWTHRQTKADAWLANHDKTVQARQEALHASIQIYPMKSWLPSAAVQATAVAAAVLVVLLGSLWRLLSPPRSFHLDGIAPADLEGAAVEGNPAAMCFRESWIRVRQPANVVLRGVVGWIITLSALAGCISVAIGSLVS